MIGCRARVARFSGLRFARDLAAITRHALRWVPEAGAAVGCASLWGVHSETAWRSASGLLAKVRQYLRLALCQAFYLSQLPSSMSFRVMLKR